MKRLPAFILLACLPCAAQTKREWQPAKVAAINSSDEEIVKPHNQMVKRPGCQGGIGCYQSVAAEPLHILTTVFLYRFESTGTTYLVRQTIRRNAKSLNVTLHGQTQIAADGMDLHILDDSGKDVKLPIVEKTAR